MWWYLQFKKMYLFTCKQVFNVAYVLHAHTKMCTFRFDLSANKAVGLSLQCLIIKQIQVLCINMFLFVAYRVFIHESPYQKLIIKTFCVEHQDFYYGGVHHCCLNSFSSEGPQHLLSQCDLKSYNTIWYPFFFLLYYFKMFSVAAMQFS